MKLSPSWSPNLYSPRTIEVMFKVASFEVSLFLFLDPSTPYPEGKDGEALRLLDAVKAVKPTAIIGVR